MKRFKYKTIAALLLTVAVVMLLAGCGGGAIPKPEPQGKPNYIPVNGECVLEKNGNELIVTGSTDLINDSILYISVHSQDGMELDGVKITKTDDNISQTFVISNKYSDVSKVYAFITCAPKLYGKQSDDVYKAYGENFEYIDNPAVVIKDEDGNPITQTVKDEDGNDIEREVKRSKFQWNNEGLIVTFMSEPIDM